MRTSSVPGNAVEAEAIALSRNGRFLAFVTRADDAKLGDGNGLPDVCVRDLKSKTIEWASAGYRELARIFQ